MKSIGQLFSRVAPEQRAALALHAITKAIQENIPGLEVDDVRAISLQRGTVTIGVKHSAISATIQRRQAEILRAANNKLHEQGVQITSVRFRITE